MKDFFKKMFSTSTDVDDKRIVGFLGFLLFVAMVVVHLTNKQIIQGELIYAVIGLVCGCYSLTSVDYRGFSKNKAKDNFLKPEQIDEVEKVIEKVSKKEDIKPKVVENVEPIEEADILDEIKEKFKDPVKDVAPKNLLASGMVYIGVCEQAGADSNKTILEFARRADIKWYNSDEIAWCAIFVNAMCDIVGLPETKSALAKSFLKWGKSISIEDAAKDNTNVIAIFHRGNPNSHTGHVGILKQISDDRKTALILGGNQSDKVCVQSFRLDSKFIGFRRA